MSFAKKVSRFLAYFKDQGIDYLTAAAKAGEAQQHRRVAQVGASPFAVVFLAQGMVNMADGTYDVIVQGPNGDERCDYATRTATGFNITGGANAEQHIIFVKGRLAGQVG